VASRLQNGQRTEDEDPRTSEEQRRTAAEQPANKVAFKSIFFSKQSHSLPCTDKKENQIFLIYKEIHSGSVAKSYMRKDFLIDEEMRKYFPIYEEAVSHI
jgi:hypothetical protein